MQRMYKSTTLAEIGLVRSLLENAGVRCIVKNEQLSSALGGIGLVQPELWIIDDAAWPRARAIIDTHAAGADVAVAWTCASCSERNEGQFAVCWCCGTADESECGKFGGPL